MKLLLMIILISSPTYANDWNGNYLSISGRHNLVISYEDQEDKRLSFEIVDFKNSERVSSAIAFFKDDLATTHSLHAKDDCIIKLSHSTNGIFVSDFCGGSDLITGFYQKIDDFSLEISKIIPSLQ
jgi:hypothetical protein